MDDEHFAARIHNEAKSTKEMWKFIMSSIKQSKNHQPSHDVVFSLAIHYYIEDKPEYIEELTQEEPLQFGVVEKHFNTPIIRHITGTIIKEVIKEVTKKEPTKKQVKAVSKKVKKVVNKNLAANQIGFTFEEIEETN
jgi:hypothetical protein